ncbi:FG-GAP repeat domain-containing protein [Streptomyces sp. NPDC088757]|uniref:FG-GAP repeat domain-containing protein n=1 Tax=Streptomyces sp. NPDC088757 TaxID=3365889 RepID=UPI0037F482D2
MRTPRHRLAAAVVAVLAVTGGLATPAVADGAPVDRTPAAVAAGRQAAVVPVPSDAVLVSSGPAGFLAKVPAASANAFTFSWTRYADGTTTTLPPGAYQGSPGTDLALTSAGSVHTLYDLATGAAPVAIDTAALGPDAVLHRAVGSTLVLSRPTGAGGTEVHLVDKPGNAVVDREVTGLPETARISWYAPSAPGTVVLTYEKPGASGKRFALVDVASGAVVEDRAVGGDRTGDVSASATHVVWTEHNGDETVLAVARRGDTATVPQRVVLGTGSVRTGLLGDWVVYGVARGGQFETNALHGLWARSLTTGKTVRLLDDLRRIGSENGDRLLVEGGTVEHGEGFYRIAPAAPGPDGTPAVTAVASQGRPTAIEAKDVQAPNGVIGLATNDLLWKWDFARGNVELRLQVTHTASGKSWNAEPQYLDRPHLAAVEWTGMFDNRTSAYNGDYTWRMTARPTDGIGPELVRTGAFRAASRPAPHDFSDSGAPDLLVRDGAGRLVGYDARQTLFETGYWGTPSKRERVDYGTGWNQYDRLTVPGNVGGSVHADVLARDKAGVLWLHQGTGKGFAPRTRIGAGWQVYDQLTGGSDLTGDRRPDLVAVDKAGDLYLYAGTGSASAPFAPRKKIGFGWGIYDRLTAVGNLAGALPGDLLARDRNGVLWLYLGKGNGAYAPRVKVGAGWNRYSGLIGVGDVNRDSIVDLVAQGVAGGTYDTLSFYLGTGDYHRPFSARRQVYNPEPLGTGDVSVF